MLFTIFGFNDMLHLLGFREGLKERAQENWKDAVPGLQQRSLAVINNFRKYTFGKYTFKQYTFGKYTFKKYTFGKYTFENTLRI